MVAVVVNFLFRWSGTTFFCRSGTSLHSTGDRQKLLSAESQKVVAFGYGQVLLLGEELLVAAADRELLADPADLQLKILRSVLTQTSDLRGAEAACGHYFLHPSLITRFGVVSEPVFKTCDRAVIQVVYDIVTTDRLVTVQLL